MRIIAVDGRATFDAGFLLDAVGDASLWLFGSTIEAIPQAVRERDEVAAAAYIETVAQFLSDADPDAAPPRLGGPPPLTPVCLSDEAGPRRQRRIIEMWGSRLVFGVPSRADLEAGTGDHDVKNGALFIAGASPAKIDVVAGRVVLSPGFVDEGEGYLDVTLAKSGAVVKRLDVDGRLMEERAFEKRRRPVKMSVQGAPS